MKLTSEQRKASIDQAEQLSGISAKAIEKDWWVTLTLKALFRNLYSRYIVFKGGTSLSKCWKIIARFSEDIDIALSPEAFEMAYIENPSKTTVERLKRRGCAFISKELKTEVEKQISALGVPEGMIIISAAVIPNKFPDTDPQTLYIRYPSLYAPGSYISDEVKVEVSVRSLSIPFKTISIHSLLNEINPNSFYGENPFNVEAVAPGKTFLEKAFLLHEEFGKPDRSKIRSERMSRHLYDLGNIMKTTFSREALNDLRLYEYLINHRKYYYRISWFDYESLRPATISFVPPDDLLNVYRQDYERMQEQMIYGENLPFDELIDQLKILQSEFRKISNM
ncbi:nucleotidyl transferase AbiEii/AbiGii toxin family protein [Niastella populi]|uniref:nucleotidyl transferase AbiEii/AbiGii toxin family protein n=1 Tax=Niastella populi TaxID=550983 RepID=UPI0013FD8D2C|nr:nucleotidyl transferase AbiEii/AbiGii toxin family protein [Niastella populi]